MGNAAGVLQGNRPGGPKYDLAENIIKYVTDEFNRVKGSKDVDYLGLEELLQMKPLQEIPVEFSHLGTLFVLDRDHNGRFSLDEICAFAELFGKRQKLYKTHEYEMHMRAYCTLQLWKAASAPSGLDAVVNWICALFSESMPLQHFDNYPDDVFINRDVIKTIHHILQVRTSYGIEFQDMFDLMQRVAEEMGTMNLEDEDLDDVVPLAVVQSLARHFLVGFIRLMTDLGFDAPIDLD